MDDNIISSLVSEPMAYDVPNPGHEDSPIASAIQRLAETSTGVSPINEIQRTKRGRLGSGPTSPASESTVSDTSAPTEATAASQEVRCPFCPRAFKRRNFSVHLRDQHFGPKSQQHSSPDILLAELRAALPAQDWVLCPSCSCPFAGPTGLAQHLSLIHI